MKNQFFSMMSRMKLINRWGLMRNTRSENISEHSLEVGMIAHALAVIRNKYFGGSVSPERAALLAMFHDSTEIITGDLPTPIKYFSSDIRSAYCRVEDTAKQYLLTMLPDELRDEYAPLLAPTEEEAELWQLVKAADKLSALIKCLEERQTGNSDFQDAEAACLKSIEAMGIPEADLFLREFIPSYGLTLDEQTV